MNGTTTLALKLAAPMQTWPAHSRGINRPTYEAPTYSALSGLVRCAFGMARNHPGDPLEHCRVAVRVDRRGPGRWDYQSINPVPIPDRRFQRERAFVANIEKMSGGRHNETVLTYREYLHDSVFVCLIEGPGEVVQPVRSALLEPVWQVFLGRKSCVPGPDFVLGLFGADIDWVLANLPVVAKDKQAAANISVPVHRLYPVAESDEQTEATWADQPAGPVGAFYQTRQRFTGRAEAPQVATSTEQRAWVADSTKVIEGVSPQ